MGSAEKWRVKEKKKPAHFSLHCTSYLNASNRLRLVQKKSSSVSLTRETYLKTCYQAPPEPH